MLWTCERQVAGDLIKERRWVCAKHKRDESAGEKRAKDAIGATVRQTAFRKTPKDRLELMLGVMGYDSTCYHLTFADAFLPKNFRGVQKEWRNFLKRLQRCSGERHIDYIYAIEGLHGDHRLHVHAVFRKSQVNLERVRMAWGGGENILCEQMKDGPDSFAELARYLTKEKRDGITHPVGSRYWGASKSLYQQLPPIQRWKDSSGFISDPDGYKLIADSYQFTENTYGTYRACSFYRRKQLI